jgi:3-oxoacyl-[acyl-carrier protein] reductase
MLETSMSVKPTTSGPLQGMCAMVTGGADGIGAAICRGLALAGAAVAVVDLKVESEQFVVAKICSDGGNAIYIGADISDEAACADAVQTCVEKLGGLNILVNCAAPGRNRSMLGKLAQTDWGLHQQVVLSAAANLTNAALEHLTVGGHGAVVNISSVTGAAIAVDQCSWPYHVSKAGLDQLTRWLAVRLGERGIRVNAIAPGLVDRDAGPKLTDNPEHRAIIKSVVPLQRAGRGEDIANAVVFLSSRQSSYMTGQVLTVDGGLGVNEVFGASLRISKFCKT